jgi:hypothetical protein
VAASVEEAEGDEVVGGADAVDLAAADPAQPGAEHHDRFVTAVLEAMRIVPWVWHRSCSRMNAGDAEVLVERRTTHVTPSGDEQWFRWLAGRLR